MCVCVCVCVCVCLCESVNTTNLACYIYEENGLNICHRIYPSHLADDRIGDKLTDNECHRHCVYAIYIYICVCVCVDVCMKEREREREYVMRERERNSSSSSSVCVCVFTRERVYLCTWKGKCVCTGVRVCKIYIQRERLGG